MADNILENNKEIHSSMHEEIEQIHDTKSVLKETPTINSDRMIIHEFVRENIQPPYDNSADYFTFKSEKDIKYDFMKPKYFFSYNLN